jgi:hypothetical protein
MTSLRRQLDTTITRLSAIRKKLQDSREYPPCCLVYKDGRISCDTFGPMPEKIFLAHCKECKKTMRELLDNMCKSSE